LNLCDTEKIENYAIKEKMSKQNIEPSEVTLSAWRDRIGRGLMLFAALAAIGAFLTGVKAVNAASPETLWVETWRMFGYLVFSGMFALVSFRPRLSAGVWELAFLHKLAMVFAALFFAGAKDAASSGVVDAILVIIIATSYYCTRGWRSWGARAN
jgi:ABC-type Fe3+-siderophore transport system permease subunit